MFDNSNRGFFWICTCFSMYCILHCFTASDSTESEDAEIEPRTSALAVRRSHNSARSHPFDNTAVAYLESLVEVDRHLGAVAAEEDDHNGGEYAGHRCVPPARTDKKRISSPAHSLIWIEKEDLKRYCPKIWIWLKVDSFERP
jgi:hypothetical protein